MNINIRAFNEDSPEVNGVSAPVELSEDHTGLKISEIQVSLNVIQVPDSDNYILASDFATILEQLIAGRKIIIPSDMGLYKWLVFNLCIRCHDQHKIELRPDRRQYAIAILDSVRNPDDE